MSAAPHTRRAGRYTPAQRFGVRFFLILAAVSCLAWAVALPLRLGLAQWALAAAAVSLAHIAGGQSSVDGDEIHAGPLTIHINFECTGVYVFLIFLTFLLAYPATWRARLRGAAVGGAALTAVNILRIALLVRVAEVQPAVFDYLHEYVWQGVFLILVIAYAMQWAEHSR